MPDTTDPVQTESSEYQLHNLARRFGEIESVQAVVVAGSRGAGSADVQSDFDIYVYASNEIPHAFRRALLGDAAEIDNRFWEPGDETIDGSGRRIDIMYRSPQWIEDQLDRILVRHQASIGYTTCFWFNVLHSQPLFDRGWFADFHKRINIEYPEALRRAIVAKNWPILRHNQSSYRRQIELALERNDAVSVQHRTTALLASFFDVWFALERRPHPGEKRLLTHLPPEWGLRVRGILGSRDAGIVDAIDQLLDPLDSRLKKEALLT